MIKRIFWLLIVISLIIYWIGISQSYRGRFQNPYVNDADRSFFHVMKWIMTRENQSSVVDLIHEIPVEKVNLKNIRNPGRFPQLTWVGHSTVLLQYEGVNVLTDPHLSQRASPFTFIGPKRYTQPAIALEELPKIDYVVISHNHYDHLDKTTVKALGNGPLWLVPLGLKEWFSDLDITNVIELNWWEEYISKHVKFVCTPSQHWSKRTLFNQFDTLWCSWAVTIYDFNFWFGGDTGYNQIQFKEIGEKFGPFNAAAIPIGGYEPRWFMKAYHVNPAEAVKIHTDIQSEFSIGIHWGTFVLTDEPINAPPKKLQEALQGKHSFKAIPIGHTVELY